MPKFNKPFNVADLWHYESRDAAIELAEHGFHIIPCLPSNQVIRGVLYKAKRPQPGFKWKEQCTSNPSRIATWFRGIYANSIPAIAIGRDNLIIVDLDIAKDGSPDGLKTWKSITEGRELPDFIPTVRTQAGGLHLYFRQPEGRAPLGNTEGELKKQGINIRGENGYVIGPGTVMPSGAKYELVNCELKDLRDAPVIMPWLIALIEKTTVTDKEPAPSEHDIDANPVRERAYIKAAIDSEIRNLTSTPKGGRNNQLNSSAFALGQMVQKGWLTRSAAQSMLMYACEANGLLKDKGRGECLGTIRSGFNGAARKPRPDPKFNAPAPSEPKASASASATPSASPEPTSRHQKGQPKQKPYNYGWNPLMKREFDELKFVCDGLIPEGCTLLASRPKMGKSWAVLDLGAAVSLGGLFMGKQCRQGSVLYLALEDSERRMQDRLRKQYPNVTSDKLWISHDWPKGDEGIYWLEEWRNEHEDATLIIVDTLARIKKEPKGRNGENYKDDYDAIGGLQKFSISAGVPMVIVHHTRKSEADDVYDTVSGTLGITGAADSILIMERQKSTGATVLHGRGRDLEEFSHLIKFNKETFRWEIGGKVDEIVYSGTRKKILEILRSTVAAMSLKDIVDKCGFKAEMVRKSLERMSTEGLVLKAERGHYVATDGHNLA